ncbi:hypothetical protein SANT12839_052600 [Streptomyces antimycoticus]|uniref:Uncharacterized protein n=1 Tax=Streptomyces antimycoticus TaxID=68175 RepID=A0A4D4KCP5_9ACTN|nr:hypothetical protein SANT12839_052600 [Streptomyces antimycoticus]
MTSSRQRTPAARIVTRETTMSMIGPPPMSSSRLSAWAKEPKKASLSAPVPEAMASVTASVAVTTV